MAPSLGVGSADGPGGKQAAAQQAGQRGLGKVATAQLLRGPCTFVKLTYDTLDTIHPINMSHVFCNKHPILVSTSLLTLIFLYKNRAQGRGAPAGDQSPPGKARRRREARQGVAREPARPQAGRSET